MTSEYTNLSSIQRNIVKALWKTKKLQRAGLVKILERPRTTIYDNLAQMEKVGIVEKLSRNAGNIGRPKIFWNLTNDFINFVENQLRSGS